MFFSVTHDKIFKLENNVFTEFTGRLDTTMIKSYQDFTIKDKNGFNLNMLAHNQNIGFINQGFLEDFESFCNQ